MIQTQITFTENREIRNGPLSRVFLATDHQLDSDIVIKEVPKKNFTNEDEYFKEARILYSVKHPNIAEMQYASENENNVYLSMPYYHKGSLQDVYTNYSLTIRKMLQYAINFLSGLHFVHTKGLLHLDIKPGNVLINNSDIATLSDFGLTKYLNEDELAKFDTIYNYHISPEACKTNLLGKQADIYQVGMTLYRMLNGENEFKKQVNSLDPRTFPNLQEKIKIGKFPDREKFLPHIPKGLKNIVIKSLEPENTKRYNSVLELLNDLSKVDKNLDWTYTNDEENQTCVWCKTEKTKVIRIYLQKSNEEWKIHGDQTFSKSGKTQKINEWSGEVYNTSIEGMNRIANLIYEYER